MGLLSFDRRLQSESAYAEAALSLISTLNAVDEHPQLYLNKSVLERAIYRYEHIWIPLLTHVRPADRTKLVPPLDVEWVWICHMLAPQVYAIDSAAIWKMHVPSKEGYVVDHAILDPNARQHGLSRAESLWGWRFPGEPFSILEEIDDAPLVTNAALAPAGVVLVAHPKSRITYDIISAAERQMAFHYQVAITPHYRESGFLETAAARYKKFLGLYTESRRYKNFRLTSSEVQGGRYVPTYDIDLMWHIHQLHPQLYGRQTKKITGRLLPHDDTLYDRTEGGALSLRWEATRRRWSAKYGGSICRMGGMFRGTLTAAERLLRAQLEANVTDIVRALPGGVDKGYTMGICPVRETIAKLPPVRGVEWLHLTDVNNALKADCEATLRISELSIADTEVRLQARLTNVAAPKDIGVYSAVEIFDTRNAHSANALPIASLHVAPAGSIVLHKPGHAFRDHANQGETLVLRIAGVDVALLAGQWAGYVVPGAGVRGIPDDKDAGREGVRGTKGVLARPGALKLAAAFIGERPRWTAMVSEYEEDEQRPPVFVIGESENFRVRVDLAAGFVQFRDKTDAVLAAVLGMGAALLHVRLQPRFQPRSGREKSLYPQWMVQQQKYAALTAGGGEWISGNRLIGYGHMLAGTAVKRGNRNSSKVWQGTQPRVYPHDSARRAEWFDDGMIFGNVTGYSRDGGGNVGSGQVGSGEGDGEGGDGEGGGGEGGGGEGGGGRGGDSGGCAGCGSCG